MRTETSSKINQSFVLESGLPFEKVNLPHIPGSLRAETEAALASLPLSYAWPGPESIEITHQQATKANGLLTVCRHLGINPSHTFAIGDSGNDIPMLRAAGFGVAMGGAPQEVQAAAKAVSAAKEAEGAARAIERYVLGGLSCKA